MLSLCGFPTGDMWANMSDLLNSSYTWTEFKLYKGENWVGKF